MTFSEVVSRFSSRKFLTTLTSQIVAIVALVNPDVAPAVDNWITQVVALAVLLLTTLGYVATEGKIDASRAEAEATMDTVAYLRSVADAETDDEDDEE